VVIGIEISGDAVITGAMNAADCNQYGWDSGWWTSSEINPNGLWAYTGNIAPSGGASGTVGYFTIHYNSGQLDIAVTTDSYAYDVSNQQAIVSNDPLILGGENQQMSSMMRGFSLNVQQAVDVNDLVNWLEQIWLEDADIRATTTEAQWQEFIDTVQSGQ
jgi:hypothetical protein